MVAWYPTLSCLSFTLNIKPPVFICPLFDEMDMQIFRTHSASSLLNKRSNCAMNPSWVPRRQAQYLSPKSLSFIPFHVRNKLGNFFSPQLVNSKKCCIFSFCLLCSQKCKRVCIVQQCKCPKHTALRFWFEHDFRKFLQGPSEQETTERRSAAASHPSTTAWIDSMLIVSERSCFESMLPFFYPVKPI